MNGKLRIPPIEWFFGASRTEIVQYLESFCTEHSDEWWLLESKRANYVMIVAHIDTYHQKWDDGKKWDYKTSNWVEDPKYKKKEMNLFYDQRKKVFWSPDGLGADDRAGVWAALHIYNNSKDDSKPTLLFCDKEESGGAGARRAAKDLERLKDKILFLLEIDRRNAKDCVFYNEESAKFVKKIEGYGFVKTFGSFSDISHIGEAWGICGVNLSAGYYDEHMKTERLYVQVLVRTYKHALKLVEDSHADGKKWLLKSKKLVRIPAWSREREWDDGFGDTSNIGNPGRDAESYGCLPGVTKEEYRAYWQRKGRENYEKWSKVKSKGNGGGRRPTSLSIGERVAVLDIARLYGYEEKDLNNLPYLVDWLLQQWANQHSGP